MFVYEGLISIVSDWNKCTAPSKTLIEDSVYRAKLRFITEYIRIKTWIRYRNMFICLSNHELKKEARWNFQTDWEKGLKWRECYLYSNCRKGRENKGRDAWCEMKLEAPENRLHNMQFSYQLWLRESRGKRAHARLWAIMHRRGSGLFFCLPQAFSAVYIWKIMPQ
jgi:hypothetical protein